MMNIKKNYFLKLICIGFLFISGCVGTQKTALGRYSSDRGNDFLDIITVVVEPRFGLGLRGAVGPLSAGLYSEKENWAPSFGNRAGITHNFITSSKTLLLGFGSKSNYYYHRECFMLRDSKNQDPATYQGCTDVQGQPSDAPIIDFNSNTRQPMSDTARRIARGKMYRDTSGIRPYQWTRIELQINVLALGLHLGVNPGEALDFMLGITGYFDIYSDDTHQLD